MNKKSDKVFLVLGARRSFTRRKIYESKKFNLLTKINLETLFEFCDSNSTYFDILLNGIKEKQIKIKNRVKPKYDPNVPSTI